MRAADLPPWGVPAPVAESRKIRPQGVLFACLRRGKRLRLAAWQAGAGLTTVGQTVGTGEGRA